MTVREIPLDNVVKSKVHKKSSENPVRMAGFSADVTLAWLSGFRVQCHDHQAKYNNKIINR